MEELKDDAEVVSRTWQFSVGGDIDMAKGSNSKAMLEWVKSQMDGAMELNGGWNDVDEDKVFETATGLVWDDLKDKVRGNTYNEGYNGPADLNYHIKESEDGRVFVEVAVHMGGDVRGNYSTSFVKEVDSVEDGIELIVDLYQGSLYVEMKFSDGSTCSTYGEQGSDCHYFVDIDNASGAMAEAFAQGFNALKQGCERDDLIPWV
jgi:hypothetical protein